MMNMGMQPNEMLMQKLMQLRQGGQQQPQGAPMMPQGGGNPNPQMPQMGGNMMPQQNPNNPMQGGMQSMAPQDPMLARKLMMMKMQGGMGGGMDRGGNMGSGGVDMNKPQFGGNMGAPNRM